MTKYLRNCLICSILVLSFLFSSFISVFADSSNDSHFDVLEFNKVYKGDPYDENGNFITHYEYSFDVPSTGYIKIMPTKATKDNNLCCYLHLGNLADEEFLDLSKGNITKKVVVDEYFSWDARFGFADVESLDNRKTNFAFKILYKPVIEKSDIKYSKSSKNFSVNISEFSKDSDSYILRYKNNKNKTVTVTLNYDNNSKVLKDMKSGSYIELKKKVNYNGKTYSSSKYKIKVK